MILEGMPDSMIYRVQNIKLNVKVHQPDLHSSSDIITPEHNRFLNFNSLTVCYLDYIFNTLTNQNFTTADKFAHFKEFSKENLFP